jgi:hypothetical protein
LFVVLEPVANRLSSPPEDVGPAPEEIPAKRSMLAEADGEAEGAIAMLPNKSIPLLEGGAPDG